VAPPARCSVRPAMRSQENLPGPKAPEIRSRCCDGADPAIRPEAKAGHAGPSRAAKVRTGTLASSTGVAGSRGGSPTALDRGRSDEAPAGSRRRCARARTLPCLVSRHLGKRMLELPRATAHRSRLARPFSSFAGIIPQVFRQVDKIGSIPVLISAKHLIRLANRWRRILGF
jgi:hypothetical protein